MMLKNSTVKEFLCPSCQGVISPEDVNVATDKALCRNCGMVSSFAEVVENVDIKIDLNNVPRGIKFIEGENHERIVSYHRFSPILLFLIPFAVCWSGFTLGGIYVTMTSSGKYDESMLFGELPFLIGTITLFSIIIYLLFGSSRLTMDQGEGTFFVGVGKLGWTRKFQYAHDSRVSLKRTNIEVNNVAQNGICVTTDDRDFVFGALMRDDAKEFLIALIRQEIRGGKSREITKI